MKQNEIKHDTEPKIFSVVIDNHHQKKFDRRQFIQSAAILGATVTLAGCDFSESNDEKQVTEASEENLEAKEMEPKEVKEPSPTASPKPTDVTVVVCTGEVTYSHSIFQGPHVDHPLLSRTVLGEEVTIHGKTPDGIWYQITDSEGTTGWVFSEFISVLPDLPIPVIENIPTQVPALCTCDNYAEPTSCNCDTYSTGCSCDNVCTCDEVHYWYPD